MRILVAIEQHFVEFQGDIYTDIAFDYTYWQAYLQVFHEVHPIARVRKVAALPNGWKRADGPGVKFVPIIDYQGFWDFLCKMFKVISDCRKATRYDGCYLLRGGNIGVFCSFFLWLSRRPYAVEVVGHTGESVLTVKNVRIFSLNRLIAYVGHKLGKLQAKKAFCASYVCRYLKTLYPISSSAKDWVFSDVKIDEQIITGARTAKQFQFKPFRIISVGRLEPEKGHLVLVKAIEQLFHQGYKLRATIVGPGKEIDSLKNYVERKGLSGIVNICGAIPWGQELFAKLDHADLFVLPSFTEGMPRALIEAMARGLPAVGSDVGGIKELLSEEYRVAPKNYEALAKKISEVIDNPYRIAIMSQTNFRKALEYKSETINQQKKEFWQYIRNFRHEKEL